MRLVYSIKRLLNKVLRVVTFGKLGRPKVGHAGVTGPALGPHVTGPRVHY